MGMLRKLLGLGPKVDIAGEIANGALILDVRTKGEFSSGHVKGSVNIPVDQLESNLRKIKRDKDSTIITCCASGMRSGVARNILKRNGYSNVYNGGPWTRVQGYKKSHNG